MRKQALLVVIAAVVGIVMVIGTDIAIIVRVVMISISTAMEMVMVMSTQTGPFSAG